MFNLQPLLTDLFRMASWSTERQLAVTLSVVILFYLVADIGISLDNRIGAVFGALAMLLAWTVGHIAIRSITNIWRGLKLVCTGEACSGR